MVDRDRAHRRNLRRILPARCGYAAAVGRGIQADRGENSSPGSAITAVGAGVAPRIARTFHAGPAAVGSLGVVTARIRHAALRKRHRARRSALLQWAARSGPSIEGFRPLYP